MIPGEQKAQRFLKLAGIRSVINTPLEALNDTGIAAGAVVVECFDSNEGTLLDNTVHRSSNRSRATWVPWPA